MRDSPEEYLISCSECSAWPMAANVPVGFGFPYRELTFVCGRCRFSKTVRISRSGNLHKNEQSQRNRVAFISEQLER
ncbi:hypothetical protein M2171_002475 [Bradyrhizobium japonicum USDA 38]|nr:hypothetical protein [Bradyrhizobium japonicum USDA 38]MCS3945856.1 hypothetical protein [Bradyrhizobium japonicum]